MPVAGLWQEFSKHLTEALASDVFVGLLQEPMANRKKVLTFCECYLQKYQEAQDSEETEKLHPAVLQCLGVFRTLASCLVALLDPRPGHCGSSVQDVEAVMQYSGDSITMQAASALLHDTEKNPWMPFLDDLLSKGPATEQLMPEVLGMVSQMQKILDDGTLLDSETMKLLQEAVPARKKFHDHLRSGLLKLFDAPFQRLATEVAENLVNSTEELMHSKENLKVLQQALQPFLQDKSVAKASNALSRWSKLNNSRLEAAGFQQMMAKYPKAKLSDEVALICVSDLGVDVDDFLKIAKTLDFSSDADLTQSVHNAVVCHFHTMVHEFGAA